MKAKDFVLNKYPNAKTFPMIDNRRMQTSYVVLKGPEFGFEIIVNEGATTASKAWTDAKKYLLTENNNHENKNNQS